MVGFDEVKSCLVCCPSSSIDAMRDDDDEDMRVFFLDVSDDF